MSPPAPHLRWFVLAWLTSSLALGTLGAIVVRPWVTVPEHERERNEVTLRALTPAPRIDRSRDALRAATRALEAHQSALHTLLESRLGTSIEPAQRERVDEIVHALVRWESEGATAPAETGRALRQFALLLVASDAIDDREGVRLALALCAASRQTRLESPIVAMQVARWVHRDRPELAEVLATYPRDVDAYGLLAAQLADMRAVMPTVGMSNVVFGVSHPIDVSVPQRELALLDAYAVAVLTSAAATPTDCGIVRAAVRSADVGMPSVLVARLREPLDEDLRIACSAHDAYWRTVGAPL